jgi:hypothetical protein
MQVDELGRSGQFLLAEQARQAMQHKLSETRLSTEPKTWERSYKEEQGWTSGDNPVVRDAYDHYLHLISNKSRNLC